MQQAKREMVKLRGYTWGPGGMIVPPGWKMVREDGREPYEGENPYADKEDEEEES